MRSTTLALALLTMLGCGDDDPDPPVDAAGVYTIATTNQANECESMGWTEGETSMGTMVTITQDGSEFTADVGGIAATYLDLVIGSHTFTGGRIDGNHLTATLVGTRAASMGACTTTVNGELDARLTGDALQGSIYYVPQTNDSPDCGVLNSCENEQRFNGTRPPTTE